MGTGKQQNSVQEANNISLGQMGSGHLDAGESGNTIIGSLAMSEINKDSQSNQPQLSQVVQQ